MAYTKILTIHDRLDNRLNYIMDANKITDGKMGYASKDMAIPDMDYVTCCNCFYLQPYQDMMDVKKLFHKTETKRQGYHLIQSFAPGEGTAEIVHEIGLKWAEEMFGNTHQYVVVTHLDKEYLHNHVIVNSTSFIDGKQYTNSNEDIRRMREISNQLCREYGLSVIENPSGKKYTKRVPSFLRTAIKKDIDKCKEDSLTWRKFVERMELEGYQFVSVEGIDCITTPYYRNPIPLNSLGKKYNRESISEYIINEVTDQKSKRFEPLDNLHKNRKQLSGLMKLYYRYLFMFGILPNYKVKKYVSPEIRKECKRLDQITQEVELMARHNITNIDDLKGLRSKYQNDLDKLVDQRKGLYNKAYREEDLIQKEKIKQEAQSLSPEIKALRNRIKMLNDIEIRSVRMENQCEHLEKEYLNKNEKSR